MKKTRFTEAQIIGILNEQEQGIKVSDLCRCRVMSYSGDSFYRIKDLYDTGDELAYKKLAVENPFLRTE